MNTQLYKKFQQLNKIGDDEAGICHVSMLLASVMDDL